MVSLADLTAAHRPMDWLWQGYVAPGNVTLLTSQWKLGKTTLVALLLARMRNGGRLAGLSVAPGRAVVVSEEGPQLWFHRVQKLDIGDHVCGFFRPFGGRPSPDEWVALIDRIAQLHEEKGISLAVIDPLASFLPSRDENSAAGMLEALVPLQQLTGRGLAVLLLHHPRKKRSKDGDHSRGSGALPAFVDILIEMHPYSRSSPFDRRRRLRAWSRHEETPRQRVIELTADGTDYLAHGNQADESFADNWNLLRAILAAAPGKLTRREIHERWPPGSPKPTEATLWKWLDRALAQGLVLREGSGRKNEAFRYGVAERGT